MKSALARVGVLLLIVTVAAAVDIVVTPTSNLCNELSAHLDNATTPVTFRLESGHYSGKGAQWVVSTFQEKFFDAMSLVNFNIELFAPECAAPGAAAFWMRWTLTMLLPLFAAANFAIVFGAGALLLRVNERAPVLANSGIATASDLAWACGRGAAQLAATIYLPLTTAVFEYFDCIDDGSGRLVLASERGTVCYDDRYWRFCALAVVGVLGYVIAIPGGLGWLLWSNKRSSESESGGGINFDYVVRLGAFVARYKDEYYMYELAVLGRKFGVALAFSFLFSTGFFEAGAAFVVLLGFYAVHMATTPYRDTFYNYLEAVCMTSSLAVLLFVSVYQVDSVSGGGLSAVVILALLVNICGLLGGIAYDSGRALAFLGKGSGGIETKAAERGAVEFESIAPLSDGDDGVT